MPRVQEDAFEYVRRITTEPTYHKLVLHSIRIAYTTFPCVDREKRPSDERATWDRLRASLYPLTENELEAVERWCVYSQEPHVDAEYKRLDGFYEVSLDSLQTMLDKRFPPAPVSATSIDTKDTKDTKSVAQDSKSSAPEATKKDGFQEKLDVCEAVKKALDEAQRIYTRQQNEAKSKRTVHQKLVEYCRASEQFTKEAQRKQDEGGSSEVSAVSAEQVSASNPTSFLENVKAFEVEWLRQNNLTIKELNVAAFHAWASSIPEWGWRNWKKKWVAFSDPSTPHLLPEDWSSSFESLKKTMETRLTPDTVVYFIDTVDSKYTPESPMPTENVPGVERYVYDPPKEEDPLKNISCALMANALNQGGGGGCSIQ